MPPTVRLTVEPQIAQVTPGAEIVLALTVENTGHTDDCYRIGVMGIPREWYTLDHSQISLAVGASALIELAIHPPSGAAIMDGRYPFQVTVASEEIPLLRVIAAVELTVGLGSTLTMSISPSEITGRGGTFQVGFLNAMAWPATLRLVVQADDALRVRVIPAGQIAVPAGGSAGAIVTVAPYTQQKGGTAQTYVLEFRGLLPGQEESPTLPVQQARFTFAPRRGLGRLLLPPRRVPLWAALPALVLLLLLLFVAGRTLAIVAAKPSFTHNVPTHVPTSALSRGSASVRSTHPVRSVRLTHPPTSVRPAHPTRAARTALAASAIQSGQPRRPAMPRIVIFALRRERGHLYVIWRTRFATSIRLQGRAVRASGRRLVPTNTVLLRLTVGNGVSHLQRELRVRTAAPVYQYGLPRPR